MSTAQAQEGRVANECGTASQYEVASTVLRLATVVRERFTEILRPFGMSWARYEVLDLLCRNGSTSYRDLTAALGRHRTSIKVTVASLEQAGYATRSSDSLFRHRVMVEPTPDGLNVFERATRALEHSSMSNVHADGSDGALDTLRQLERVWSRPSSVSVAER